MHRTVSMLVMLAIAAIMALSTARAQVRGITLTAAEYQALVDDLVRRDPALAMLLEKQQQAQAQAQAPAAAPAVGPRP